jgi:hypothetical protein
MMDLIAVVKNQYNNILSFIPQSTESSCTGSGYTVTSILMSINGCNWKFYNKYLSSYFTNKNKVMGQIMAQKTDIH